MRCLALICLSLLLAPSAHAQTVEVLAQEANLETLAGAQCRDDEPPEADLGKFYSLEAVPHDEQVSSEMTSPCSAASCTARGTSSMGDDALVIHLSTSATLEQFGGAIANAQIEISFRVHEPTDVVLEVLGSNTNSVEDVGRNFGGVFLSPSVGQPLWSVQVFPLTLDETWEATLEPGTYWLLGSCGSIRNWRSVGEFDLFEDGHGTADLAVMLRFPGREVVATEELSVGQLKAGYLR